MKFIDEAAVEALAGPGGDGIVSWRREKYLPNGGPDGGNGGDGGAVVLVASSDENTLLPYSYNPRLIAEPGKPGGANLMAGACGKDKIFPVPVGTQVFFDGKIVADLNKENSRWVAARGGRGGRGNASYKSPSCQAPDYARPGQPGEGFRFRLVLKSMADVGVVGLPNAGKSTLISAISAATPKVADYPFTTIKPSLGVVDVGDEQNFVIADIPGLVPGAHQGRGLGIRFLKHLERTAVLAHLVDASSLQFQGGDSTLEAEVQRTREELVQIENELEQFSKDLCQKNRLIVFSKADQTLVQEVYEKLAPEFEKQGFQCLLVSSVSGEGLKTFKEKIYEMIQHARNNDSIKETDIRQEALVNSGVMA